jgi:hypothetical protein
VRAKVLVDYQRRSTRPHARLNPSFLTLQKDEELAELARLYQAKREPILKAIEAKRAMAAS